jgi:hypothetical protein
MASILLPAGIRVAVEYDLNGKTVVNIYHVTDDNPITSIRLDAVAALFITWWTDNMAQEFSEDIALTSVTATDISVANGEQSVDTPVTPIAGEIVQPATANNLALVTSFRTNKTGRSFRGRSYQAGFSRVDITDNQVGLQKATDIGTAYVDLIDDLNVNNFNFVVASFAANGEPRLTGVATPVTSIIVNRRVDTQRRRLPTDT